jgi:SAM-dependent methyltransferase
MPEDRTRGPVLYGPDLARIHDRGFGRHAVVTAPGVLALIDGVRSRGGIVHEFGCGSGALTRYLVEAGHRVIASDASPAFVELARQHLPGVDVRRIRLPDDPLPQADAVVGVGHALNYLPDVAGVERALAAIAASLRPGGVLALDLCDLRFAAGKNEAPYVRVEDDWTMVTRFTSPRPELFVRDITMFLREGDGRFRRSDERHESVLLDTATVPARLGEEGVDAEVRPAFGAERLPRGLVTLVGVRRPGRSASPTR